MENTCMRRYIVLRGSVFPQDYFGLVNFQQLGQGISETGQRLIGWELNVTDLHVHSFLWVESSLFCIK